MSLKHKCPSLRITFFHDFFVPCSCRILRRFWGSWWLPKWLQIGLGSGSKPKNDDILMIPVVVVILYQIFSRFFIDFRCFFDAFLQAFFEKNEKWKSAQNTINKHTNSMSGTSKKTQKSTKKSSKNSTKKNIRKSPQKNLPGTYFLGQKWMHILSRGLPRGQEQLFKKKTLFFDCMRTAFFRFLAPQRGHFIKVRASIFGYFSTFFHACAFWASPRPRQGYFWTFWGCSYSVFLIFSVMPGLASGSHARQKRSQKNSSGGGSPT